MNSNIYVEWVRGEPGIRRALCGAEPALWGTAIPERLCMKCNACRFGSFGTGFRSRVIR